MGNKTINGITARLDSALNDLRGCLDSINETTKQYKPEVSSKFDQETKQIQWFIKNIPDIEPKLEVELSSILLNLRCAVDQAVYSMAIIGNKGAEPIDKRNVCLPIYTEECDFENKISTVKAFKKNFDNAVINMIRDLQPFHGLGKLSPSDHPLEVLKFLSNHLKHRSALILYTLPIGMACQNITAEGLKNAKAIKDSMIIEQGPFDNNQIFARLECPDNWEKKLNTVQFCFDYAFETTPKYYVSQLGLIYHYVKEEVFEKRFMPYLERNQHRLK